MSSSSFTFTVHGRVATQGSKTVKGTTRRGKVKLVDACEHLDDWRHAITKAAHAALPDGWDLGRDRAMTVSAVFLFERPPSHLKQDGTLRVWAPRYCIARKGDIDKLCRALLDGLTHTAYDDDDQVVSLAATRRWKGEGESYGAIVTVTQLDYR